MKITLFGLLLTLVFSSPASKDYTYVDYDRFMTLLEKLKTGSLNNCLFKIYDGFERYEVSPRPACGHSTKYPCRNPVIEIANHQKGQQFVSSLPTVLLIGGFHGDEVVGTNALYYLIELFQNNYYKDPFYGNLLDNVRILLLPMANVNGFYRQQREEQTGTGESVDPNRDFPFDLLSGQGCFRTSTAVLLDAIFRKNLIVGCMTFHGGDNSITYPWGAPAHQTQPQTADQIAFNSVAEMLRKAASNNPSMGVQTYDVGTMHKVVYDVRGGFEDWAYAASDDRQSVSSSCAVRENPRFDLFKESVSYDLTSNRAFVYLVEAGHNKIPDELFLGNETPLTEQRQDVGKWGHVTRNINVALRMAETVRPHAVVSKIAFDGKLKIDVIVKGCVKIDQLLHENGSFRELRREHYELMNQWRLFLEFDVSAGTTRSITFGVVCDRKFSNPTLGNAPITHFVKLRTSKEYSLNFQGNRVRAQDSIKVSVVNIRTDMLNNAVVQWNPGNVNSLTYTNALRGIQTGKARQSDQIVHISYSQNKLHVQTLATSGNNKQKELKVRKYGAMSNKWKAVSPRHLAEFKSGEDYEYSAQTFLSLVGKDVDVVAEKGGQLLYTQTLIPDSMNEYEEEMNALFLPASGVNCRSDESASPFFFLEATRSKDGSLKVNLMTDNDEFYNWKIGSLKHDFELTSAVSFEGRSLSRYQSTITVAEVDDLRLLGRTLELFVNKKTKIFTCVLAYRDPAVGQLIQPELGDTTQWIFREVDQQRRTNAYVLLLLVSLMAALIFIGVKYRQRSFSEGSEKDLRVIIGSASGRE